MEGKAFRGEVLSIQKAKSFFFFFLYLLWLETKMSTLDGPSTLVQFIDWLGFR